MRHLRESKRYLDWKRRERLLRVLRDLIAVLTGMLLAFIILYVGR